MNKRKLGKNGPELSEIGLGAWAIGGAWKFGWGPSDDKESIRTIHRALDLGINWIDTAAAYGLGHSEEVVGKAIKDRRDQVYVATKCGLVWNAKGQVWNDISRRSIRQEIEASLKRLNLDVIDLYQIHWPYANQSEKQAWHELVKLKKEGKVRWLGVSNFDVTLLKNCEKIHHIDSLQPPYNLLRREVESEIVPFCQQNGIGVIAYSPMMSGLLSGRFDITKLANDDWRRRDPFFQEPGLSKHLDFVNRLRQIAQKYDKTVGQLAVAWVLRQPALTAAIVGARRVDHVEQNVKASGWTLDDEDLEQIDRLLRDYQL